MFVVWDFYIFICAGKAKVSLVKNRIKKVIKKISESVGLGWVTKQREEKKKAAKMVSRRKVRCFTLAFCLVPIPLVFCFASLWRWMKMMTPSTSLLLPLILCQIPQLLSGEKFQKILWDNKLILAFIICTINRDSVDHRRNKWGDTM